MHSLDISIRAAQAADLPALRRVAERDSRPLPSGDLLVAAVQGEVHAALSVQTGEVVADPFRPTAAMVELLRVRARQSSGDSTGTRGRAGKLAVRPAET